jgi:hypothetical protein
LTVAGPFAASSLKSCILLQQLFFDIKFYAFFSVKLEICKAIPMVI